MKGWTYELYENVLHINVDAESFTIDLLPEIIRDIISALSLPRAESIKTIEVEKWRRGEGYSAQVEAR